MVLTFLTLMVVLTRNLVKKDKLTLLQPVRADGGCGCGSGCGCGGGGGNYTNNNK